VRLGELVLIFIQSFVSKSIQLKIRLNDAEPLYLIVLIHHVSTPSMISFVYTESKTGMWARWFEFEEITTVL